MRMELAQTSEVYVVNSMVLETQRQHCYSSADQNHIAAEFKAISDSDIYALILKRMNIDFLRTATAIVQNEITFEYLRLKWQRERGSTSSITAMAMCPSYQRIMTMAGAEVVVPLILRQMESEGDEPDMWFWALRILTNADPVADDDRGDIVRMAQAWLNWGRDQYVW